MRFPFVGSDKIVYGIDGVSKFMIHYVIEVQGRLQQQQLAEAIDLALAKSPILKSVARLRNVAPYWEVLEDVSPYSILTVEDLSQDVAAAAAARSVVEKYINEYVDVTQSPPARFLLIKLPADRLLLVVKVHHCALDPLAILHLIEDIQDYYGKLLQREPIPLCAPMEARGRWPLFKNVSLLLWGEVIRSAVVRQYQQRRQRRGRSRAHVRFSAPAPQSDTISYRTLRLEGTDYLRLRARAKSIGITVNELAIAALCCAIRRWNGGQERANGVYNIIMPVDVRRYVRKQGRVPRIMSNYVGGTLVAVPVEVAADFQETVHYVTEEVHFIRDHQIGLRHNLMLPLLYFIPPQWLRRTVKKFYARRPSQVAPTAILAYMGKLDRVLSVFPDCEIKTVEAIGTGFYPVGFDVAILAYGKEYTITFSYLKQACPEAEIESFMELFSHELLAESFS